MSLQTSPTPTSLVLKVFDTVPLTKTDLMPAHLPLGPRQQPLAPWPGAAAAVLQPPPLPRSVPCSPPVQLGRLGAAAQLHREPQAPEPAGSPASPDAQRRRLLPPLQQPACCGPAVSGIPRSRLPNAPTSALARANAVPGSALTAPAWQLPVRF